MGFWDFFRNKKNEDSSEIESLINKDDSRDIIFVKNFTSSGGRFTFIDEKNSTNEIFEKIIEENQWSSDNVCSLDSNISKNLGIRLIRKISNDNVKALVTECANSNQFVSDVSEGMTKLKNKYKANFPTNITTINVKNKLNEEDFLNYGNGAKDIYLILSDD